MNIPFFKFLSIAFLIGFSAFAAESPDLNKLQGRWECKKTDESGQKVTLVMNLKKDKLAFQMKGAVTFYATADIKLEKLGSFHVFSSRNIRAGTAEDDLQDVDEEFSYVYQIDGDTLYLAANFDKARDRAPALDIYRKVSDSK